MRKVKEVLKKLSDRVINYLFGFLVYFFGKVKQFWEWSIKVGFVIGIVSGLIVGMFFYPIFSDGSSIFDHARSLKISEEPKVILDLSYWNLGATTCPSTGDNFCDFYTLNFRLYNRSLKEFEIEILFPKEVSLYDDNGGPMPENCNIVKVAQNDLSELNRLKIRCVNLKEGTHFESKILTSSSIVGVYAINKYQYTLPLRDFNTWWEIVREIPKNEDYHGNNPQTPLIISCSGEYTWEDYNIQKSADKIFLTLNDIQFYKIEHAPDNAPTESTTIVCS